MADWLFTRKFLVISAMLFLPVIGLAVAFRESTLGNIASIVGLAVSVLGIVVTIWTVSEARKQIQESGDKAEEAIAQASEEARRVVQGIAGQLRASDCDHLRGGVEDLRQATQDAKWLRAVFRCQECRRVAYRLAQDKELTREEASALVEGADDLLQIQLFIEKNRLADQPGLLKRATFKGWTAW